jgi:outer membrane protein assembly factor BamB
MSGPLGVEGAMMILRRAPTPENFWPAFFALLRERRAFPFGSAVPSVGIVSPSVPASIRSSSGNGSPVRGSGRERSVSFISKGTASRKNRQREPSFSGDGSSELTSVYDMSFHVLKRSALLAVVLVAVEIQATADDWPQWLGPRRDSVWRETGILERFPKEGPPVRWRVPIGGGYAGPAVAGERVYVMDRQLASGATNPNDPFQRGIIPGQERVLCLDRRSGEIVWQHRYDCPYTVSYPAGPRVTPSVHDGSVYTLGAEGHLLCLDAANGKVQWSRDLRKDFNLATPMWGFAGHPLVDGERLICLVGGTGSVAVAFDRRTGKELWRSLSAKEPGYCPPMIFEAGGKRQLIIWHPESINSLDPETGKVYWSEPWEIRSGLSVPTPRHVGKRLYFTSFYNGSLMLELAADRPAATVSWRSKKVSEKDTDALHSIMSTPFMDGEHIYGVCSYGQLRGLRASSGERLWETLAATTGDKEARWANVFLVRQEDRYFLFNEKGELIIARLSPAGYDEISRAQLLEPTGTAMGRPILWSHPAFAHRQMFARNDKELICVDLSVGGMRE